MTKKTIAGCFAAAAAFGVGISSLHAQQAAECRLRTTGPDVIVGELSDMSYYGRTGDMHAFSVGTISCNAGTANILWIANNNQHPVIGQNMYRIKDGAIEMVGMSWLKHGFTALTGSLCASCSGQGGAVLGVGCSDPYGSGLNGSQGNLGPRWQVNAATGFFNYPHAEPAYSGNIARRLQVADADINPAQNAGALYLVEGQYVTADDAAAGNSWNNVSYRRVNFTYGTTINYTWGGPTQCTRPAIMAWRDHGLGHNMPDPGVTLVSVDVPGDGRFWVGCKVTDNGDGTWHYEYAIQNITSDRSGGGFRVPLPSGSVAENMGFHDCPYHSGDGIPTNITQPNTTARNFESNDWSVEANPGEVRWFTQAFAANENANALRWGTLYNFRFDTNAQPGLGEARIDLFKPGTQADVVVPNIPVPTTFVPRNVRVVLSPASIPELIPPTQPTDVEASIIPGDDQVQPGSARLYYRYTTGANDPFTAVDMTPTGVDNIYRGTIPGSTCGNFVSFYVQAAGTNSGTVSAPLDGSVNPIVRPVGTVSQAFDDDFETDKNWSGVDPSDTATAAGRWVRADPVGTAFNPGTGIQQIQPADDHTADPGVNCWFTGQGVGGGSITAADVDGGKTTLTSPIIDLSDALTARVSYWRWYVSGIAGTRQDPFTVEVSNDGGATWSNLETVPADGANGGWVYSERPITIALTSQMRVRFIAQDLGTDDVVEAGVDDFRITKTACTDNVCRADWNGQGGLTLQDLFDYLGDWFAGDAEYDVVPGTTLDDLFAYLGDWFRGC